MSKNIRRDYAAPTPLLDTWPARCYDACMADQGANRKRGWRVRFSIESMLVAFVVVAVAMTLYRSLGSLAVTKRHGDEIIQALGRYHDDRGHYPANLDELFPRYLVKAPTATWGLKKWEYTNAGGGFTLAVREVGSDGYNHSLYAGSSFTGWSLSD
jgi:hypothetical protein